MVQPDLVMSGDIDIDDEDEALRYAIALSLQDEQSSATPNSNSGPSSSLLRDSNRAPVSTGLHSLDRQKMEQERLQRLAKRHRSPSAEEDDDVVEVPPPKRKPPPEPKSYSVDGASSVRLPYPDGVVKRTWARGYRRCADDITIEEIFQKDKLEIAVLSSFQWDEDWMMSKLDMRKTKVLLVAYAADDTQKETMRAIVPPSLRFCFPPMNGPGSMHSKLQLLKFPGYVRVVIPTGNLVPYDWGETGVMENMVFLIDLPKLANSNDHRPTNFSTELCRFLQAMGVDQSMVLSLANYDFSKTAHLGFVYTIPGGHVDEAQKRVGYCGLGAAVSELGLATKDPVEVDLVCASLGAVNCDLAGAIYNACQGDDGMREFTARKPASKSTGIPALLKQHFRIYFPTGRTVYNSRGGRDAGGTICVQAKWWRASTFPRELVRDCVSTRDGLLMHSKMIFVRKTKCGGADASAGARSGDSDGRGQVAGWAYVGSANLSESAWGRVVKDRASGKIKMSCRNWECGVVLAVPESAAAGQGPSGNAADLSMFAPTVPVPMKMPGRAYGPNEEPWYFMQA